MRGPSHPLRLAVCVLLALLACAAPAGAATPVSDQYQSAAPPILRATSAAPTASGHATSTPATAPTPAGAVTSTGAVAGQTAAGDPTRHGSQVAESSLIARPIAVARTGVTVPLRATTSNVPFVALAALALLALALLATAIRRLLRPSAAS